MSTYGTFVLHLYCDEPGCTAQGEVTGLNGVEARKAARAKGWRIFVTLHNGDGVCYCKAHVRSHRGAAEHRRFLRQYGNANPPPGIA